MAQTNANVVALQLEKVRDTFETLYERDNVFYALIKTKGEAEKVSSRDMRVPLQIRPGGNAGQASMAGADLGRGSATQYEKAVVSPIFFKFAVEINKEVEYHTDSKEKAIANAVKREVKNGMAQFRAFLDKLCQTDGSGVLGTIATGGAADPLVLDSNIGTQAFYPGQTVSTFTANFATKRGDLNVVSLTNLTTMDIDALPAGTVDTDVVTVSGLTAGAGTQQSLFGLRYHASDAATGTWLGLDRSLFPEIRTPKVAGGGAALDLDKVRLALNKFILNLGAEATPKDLIAYTHPAQAHQYEKLGTAISTIMKQGGNEKMDLLFGDLNFGGVPMKWSINADPTVIDFLSPSKWGRAVSKEIDLYEVDGNTTFPIYGASGGIATAEIFYFVTGFQIYNINPRCGSYIDALTKPAGY